ncbi:NAD(P)-dependent oxidoreductase [Acinetobacter sp. MD2]|uniref:NAD-dependent epimerase/dehydratase family protein n=1 Tax=Acinetobacter sp. MD2 TaxID=2600066 RepID=UPI002D1E5BE6|nr:NAD(P)-dependent oxidoreductase [Acinetobacter sp. MD2]MEB3767745.1 NAD(P)-dependent oxidoreductase [Acinetobacter sp. MD2]
MHASTHFHRILLTGAAGGLGKVLRQRLQKYAQVIRLSDISEIVDLEDANEEIRLCDLSSKHAVHDLVEGVDAIIHFGGVSTEHSFEDVLGPNICGTYHIYEAARQHGVKRVIFASSNHVIGFHPRGETLETDCLRKPDGYYGLSKSYGEDLATFYWHRYGIETVSIRIGSAFPEPNNPRMLSTWLHYDDLEQLIFKGLTVANVGHTVVFGASNNAKTWWDNTGASHLGYQPQHSADPYTQAVQSQNPPAADPGVQYQGGGFTEAGPFEDVRHVSPV